MEHIGYSTNICWISELIDLVVFGKFILKEVRSRFVVIILNRVETASLNSVSW